MLSVRQIERMIHAGEAERLIERILANGRCNQHTTAALLQRLRADAPGAMAVAALGLAVGRIVELTFGRHHGLAGLTRQLTLCQAADGSFAGSISATVLALRGLLDLPDAPDQLAIKSALQWLRDRLDNAGPAEIGFVLWQLGSAEQFRCLVDLDRLRSRAVSATDRDCVADLARAVAA